MARMGGFRRKTRHKLKKPLREKGKVTLSRHLKKFKVGDRVTLILEPSVHKGVFNPRFHGRSGIVKSKKGECYEIEIKDSSKKKSLTIHPVHLRG